MATIADASDVRDIMKYYIDRTTASWRYDVADLTGFENLILEHNKPNRPMWIAEKGGKIIGFSYLSAFRAPEGYWPCAEDTVYVHPDYCGLGIGHRLMKLLIESANEARLQAIVAAIDTANEDSIRFHEQFGFYRCGYLKKVAWKHNSFRDLLLMQLDLKALD